MKLYTLSLYEVKKIFAVLFIMTLLSSCDSDDGSEDVQRTYFSPPNWIIGTWQVNSSDSSISPQYNIFEFTRDNFIAKELEEQNLPDVNFNSIIRNSSFDYEVEEFKTNNTYEIIIRFVGIPSSYRFVKQNDESFVLYYDYNIDYSDPDPPFTFTKVE